MMARRTDEGKAAAPGWSSVEMPLTGGSSSRTLWAGGDGMTPWDRFHDRIAGMPQEDRRRWLLVGVSLIAVALVVAISPLVAWQLVTIALWLLALGAVVYVAVRLAHRPR
jgi:MFS family permease